MINNRERINVKDFISALSTIAEKRGEEKIVNINFDGLKLINGVLRNTIIIELESGRKEYIEAFKDKENM